LDVLLGDIGLPPGERLGEGLLVSLMIPRIGISRRRIPRFRARARASSMLRDEVKTEGMVTPTTASGPRASTARAAVSAESIPPLNPTTTSRNPFFLT
jgi:hypothetical protein